MVFLFQNTTTCYIFTYLEIVGAPYCERLISISLLTRSACNDMHLGFRHRTCVVTLTVWVWNSVPSAEVMEAAVKGPFGILIPRACTQQ